MAGESLIGILPFRVSNSRAESLFEVIGGEGVIRSVVCALRTLMDIPTDDKIVPKQEFGKWTVESYAGKYRSATCATDQWTCVCQCGTRRVIQRSNLLRGQSTQCQPCALKQIRENRLYKPRQPRSQFWDRLKKQMCDEWQANVAVFIQWCDETRNGRFLNRQHVDQPYSPENCYWSDTPRHAELLMEELIASRCQVLGETREQAVAWCNSVTRQRRDQWMDLNGGDDERRQRLLERQRKNNRICNLRKRGLPLDTPVRTKVIKETGLCIHGNQKRCDQCRQDAYELQKTNQRNQYRAKHGIPLDKPVRHGRQSDLDRQIEFMT